MNCIMRIVKKQLLFFYKTTVQSQLPKCFAFCQYGVSAKYNFINCLKNANILCQLYEIVLGSEQLYIFNLPINRCYTMLLQKPVCLTEWFAAEKSSVSRKRAWMRCFQYQMMRIVQHGFLLLCRTPPENKHDRSVLLIQYLNSCICELFPADSSMGIRLMRTNGQNCILEQHTLFRPFLKIAVIWNIASEIILQFLVDVFQ